jgi:hypothetical protein
MSDELQLGDGIRLQPVGYRHLRVHGMPPHHDTVRWLYRTVDEVIKQQQRVLILSPTESATLQWAPPSRLDTLQMTIQMWPYQDVGEVRKYLTLPLDVMKFTLLPLGDKTRVDIEWAVSGASQLVPAIMNQIAQHWPPSNHSNDQRIDNLASNLGAQGVFNGPVNFYQGNALAPDDEQDI